MHRSILILRRIAFAATLLAFCVVVSQAPMPPSEMLSTLAGFAFAGTPDTLPPELQMMASAMSEV